MNVITAKTVMSKDHPGEVLRANSFAVRWPKMAQKLQFCDQLDKEKVFPLGSVFTHRHVFSGVGKKISLNELRKVWTTNKQVRSKSPCWSHLELSEQRGLTGGAVGSP